MTHRELALPFAEGDLSLSSYVQLQRINDIEEHMRCSQLELEEHRLPELLDSRRAIVAGAGPQELLQLARIEADADEQLDHALGLYRQHVGT